MDAGDSGPTTTEKKSGKHFQRNLWSAVTVLVAVAAIVVPLIKDSTTVPPDTNLCDTHKGLTRIEAVTVTADSVRSPQPPLDYEAVNLNDNDPTTIWIEGDPDGYGTGQQLQFTLPADTDLQLLCIVNGFARSEAQYAKNSRVEQLSVETEQGTQVTVIPDKQDEDFAGRQPLNITKGKTSHVTIILEEARAASGVDAAKDMSVSDILFWVRP